MSFQARLVEAGWDPPQQNTFIEVFPTTPTELPSLTPTEPFGKETEALFRALFREGISKANSLKKR